MQLFTNNCRMGKCLNIETKYNPHSDTITYIERDLKKMHRGWGKHRIEDEMCTTYCERLGKVVYYQKGKPKYKDKKKGV